MAFEQIVQGGGILTQPFGCSGYGCASGAEWNCPGLCRCRSGFHAGIDIAAGPGAVLTAVGPGECIRIGRAGGACGGLGPHAICIRSGPVDIWYGHASSHFVSPGAFVGPGQPLGVMGSLGCSTGRHVHFEVQPAGSVNGCAAVDPWAYVSRWPAPSAPPPPPPPPPGLGSGPWALMLGGAALALYAAQKGGGT